MIIIMKRIQKVEIMEIIMMTFIVDQQMIMMNTWMKERLLETFMNMRQSITIFLTVGNMRESFINLLGYLFELF